MRIEELEQLVEHCGAIVRICVFLPEENADAQASLLAGACDICCRTKFVVGVFRWLPDNHRDRPLLYCTTRCAFKGEATRNCYIGQPVCIVIRIIIRILGKECGVVVSLALYLLP